ncbi:MAG: hypothetical protein IGQ45_03385 [Cyanobacterium sp. T60_A2020_053]|nr:hypothetical protein [Cyanobacterium sp. T60_A2020_053]MBF2056270.1 hypothetical protein [Cyanobacterium sp. T60_A2020_053]
MKRGKRRSVNLSLHPKLYDALDLYCKENNVLKTELISLLLLKYFSQVEINQEVKSLLHQVDSEDLLSKYSPLNSQTLSIPELSEIWFSLIEKGFSGIPSSVVRLLIDDPDKSQL